jgi:hypothetical protein
MSCVEHYRAFARQLVALRRIGIVHCETLDNRGIGLFLLNTHAALQSECLLANLCAIGTQYSSTRTTTTSHLEIVAELHRLDLRSVIVRTRGATWCWQQGGTCHCSIAHQFEIPDSRSRIPDPGYRIPDLGSSATKCSFFCFCNCFLHILFFTDPKPYVEQSLYDTDSGGSRIPDTGYRIPDPGSRIPVPETCQESLIFVSVIHFFCLCISFYGSRALCRSVATVACC